MARGAQRALRSPHARPAQPARTPCARTRHELSDRVPRGSASLEMMKELQRQRKREKGVSLELKGTDGDAEELNPDEEARELVTPCGLRPEVWRSRRATSPTSTQCGLRPGGRG